MVSSRPILYFTTSFPLFNQHLYLSLCLQYNHCYRNWLLLLLVCLCDSLSHCQSAIGHGGKKVARQNGDAASNLRERKEEVILLR